MHIAILTFDGYNELDSLIAFGMSIRMNTGTRSHPNADSQSHSKTDTQSHPKASIDSHSKPSD